MLIYKTSGKDAIWSAFFAELDIQILIAERAYDTLYNQHLYAHGDRTAKTCTPIKGITDFALFLNSSAMISKILGLAETYKTDRTQNLRTMMEIDLTKIDNLKGVGLRNSMEHMDERLDLLNDQNPSELVIWDLTQNKPATEHTLRKFNPFEFTMYCIRKDLSSQILNVKDCYSEIQYIKSALATGRKKLSSST